jgi:hypothetical protein
VTGGRRLFHEESLHIEVLEAHNATKAIVTVVRCYVKVVVKMTAEGDEAKFTPVMGLRVFL